MVDKQKQFELITNGNPFNSELGNHTWIKDVSDIKTYEEVWQEEGEILRILHKFFIREYNKVTLIINKRMNININKCLTIL